MDATDCQSALGPAAYAPGMTDSRRPTFVIAVLGTLAVGLYAVWGAVQILVLNPLAAAPGMTLTEIHTALTAANERIGVIAVVAFLASGLVIAVIAATVLVSRRAAPELAAAVFLGILVLGTPAYFVASFGPGMALADTFMISGADASPWAAPLYVVSLLAQGAILGVALRGRRRAAVAVA